MRAASLLWISATDDICSGKKSAGSQQRGPGGLTHSRLLPGCGKYLFRVNLHGPQQLAAHMTLLARESLHDDFGILGDPQILSCICVAASS